jgi:hypothetical protein
VNATQAKHALLLYRPRARGQAQAEPELAHAIEFAQTHGAVSDWLRRHTRFQDTMQRSFRELPVPAQLTAQILARRRIVRLPWWRKPWSLAAAAALFLLVGGSVAHWQQNVLKAHNTFSIFLSRMVGNVLRQYTMDIVTNDTATIQRYLAGRQAPSDYQLPPGLARLPQIGCGVLGWGDGRVSMICLQPPGESILYLFVADQAAVHPVPPATPQFQQVNSLMTATWSQGGKVYILATPGSRESLQRHF